MTGRGNLEVEECTLSILCSYSSCQQTHDHQASFSRQAKSIASRSGDMQLYSEGLIAIAVLAIFRLEPHGVSGVSCVTYHQQAFHEHRVLGSKMIEAETAATLGGGGRIRVELICCHTLALSLSNLTSLNKEIVDKIDQWPS